MRITVPLCSLHLSAANVRKAARYKRIDELAGDIAAHGIIENLVVRSHESRANIYEVTAGGRRLVALQLLLERGTIGKDYDVPVLVDQADDPRETSLAENVHQEPMNPADEATAWADLVAGRASVADDPISYIARRFGKEVPYVAARLRLAELPSEILEALRDEVITLDAALAYAIVPDEDLQRQVFAAESARTVGRQHEPRTIRDAMRAKTYPATVRQAIYVGADAYRAAGGTLGRDLFLGQDEGDLFLQPALVDQLAREKATAELADRAAADGFGSGLLTLGFNSVPTWPKAPPSMTRIFAAAPGSVPADRREEMIGIYNIASDGDGLALEGAYRPIAHLADPKPATAATPPQRAATATDDGPVINRDMPRFFAAAASPVENDRTHRIPTAPCIYVASRASVPERAAMWRELRDSGVDVISSWIDEDGEGETADWSKLWKRIGDEVAASDALILYAEPSDFPLKGALIEAGMALAHGLPVYVVAPRVELGTFKNRPIGSWVSHPLVAFADTVAQALSDFASEAEDA